MNKSSTNIRITCRQDATENVFHARLGQSWYRLLQGGRGEKNLLDFFQAAQRELFLEV